MRRPWVKPALIELAWLLCSWAFSFGLVGWLTGRYSGTLDIQMHNTYWILPVWLLATLLFLLVAPLITLIRVLQGLLRNRAANWVLGLLGSIWLLLALAILAVRPMR